MKKQFNFNFKYLCLTSTALNQRSLSGRFWKKCIVLSTALIAITHECIATPPIALTWNVGTNDQTVWDGTNNVTIPSGQALKKTGLGTAIITKSQTSIASGSTVDVSAGTLQINNTQSLGGAGLVMEDNSIFSIGANVTIANPITVGKSSSTGTSTITGLGLDNSGASSGPFSPTFSGAFTQGGTSSSLIVGQTGDTGTFTFSSDMSAMPVKLSYGTTCFTNTPATAINLSGGTLKYSGNGFGSSTLTLTDSTYSTLDVNGQMLL